LLLSLSFFGLTTNDDLCTLVYGSLPSVLYYVEYSYSKRRDDKEVEMIGLFIVTLLLPFQAIITNVQCNGISYKPSIEWTTKLYLPDGQTCEIEIEYKGIIAKKQFTSDDTWTPIKQLYLSVVIDE